jgi:hypothetical protein
VEPHVIGDAAIAERDEPSAATSQRVQNATRPLARLSDASDSPRFLFYFVLLVEMHVVAPVTNRIFARHAGPDRRVVVIALWLDGSAATARTKLSRLSHPLPYSSFI